ncbi:MAG: filamentous hemagglutinin N-terminal domain-containing protein, partial [Desulfurivibrionaceae bacterium]
MNKRCYRMVFNKARGILMAVAEIAVSQGKASGETSGKAVVPGAVRGSALRALTFSAWATLAINTAGFIMWTAPALGQGQIVADPNAPANQRPTILAAPNGVPFVNIQTPSAAGVSRNTYRQFDVQQQGAILNNSRTDAQTQLGGWVQGNPWLATGSARVILNEVNSSNPSLLQGYVEVAGSRAQVVIANPAGVTCDGCGFINANRATLTTGAPVFSGGSLDGYSVHGGIIKITGVGLDTSTADYTDLIARSVQVNAGIWAKQLTVTAGANQVEADHSVATPIVGVGVAPAFAIDVAQLGGMYAGKIILVGTETGVGVRNAGDIGASVGEVIVTANGRLENAGRITSTSHTQIEAANGINNSGVVYAQGNVTIDTRANIDNSGVITALGNTTLAATGANSRITSTNSSVLGAGVQVDGSLGNSGALNANATKTLTAQGHNLSGGDQTLVAQTINLSGSKTSVNGDIAVTAIIGDIGHVGGNLQANGAVNLNAANAIKNDNGVIVGHQLAISGDSLSNQGGNIDQSGSGDTRITTAGAIVNSGGVLASNGQNLVLQSDSLNNRNGSLTLTGTGLLMVRSGSMGNNGGMLATNGGVDIVAASLDNSDGTIYGTGNLTIQSNGALSNQRGLIQTDADLNVAAVGTLNNANGGIEANGAASSAIVSGASFDNTAGRIVNNGAGITAVSGASVVNNNAANIQGRGVIGGNGEVVINAANLVNIQGGQVVAGGNLNLNTSSSLNNNTGVLFAQANLIVNQPGATLSNVDGHIGASGDVDLAVTSLDNTNGQIGNMQNSGGNLGVLATGNVTNTGGEIASGQDLRMVANALVGDGAVIGERDASLSLQGNYTQTAGNLITANRDLVFGITGNLTNVGTLQAASNLVVNAANITNQGELGAGDKFSAGTATLRNMGSIVGGDVAIVASQKIENVGPSAFIGASNALGKLELLAPTIENRDETTGTDILALTTIYGLGQVVLAGSKDAESGQYTKASKVVNTSSLIQSGGDMSIYADTLTNTRRVLVATNSFTQVGQANGSVIWTVANPDVPGGRYIEPPHEDTWNSAYVQTDYTETLFRNSLASISPEAQIISGGNLNPAVNLLRNYWSKVTAAGNISLNGVTLDQDSWRGATPYLQRADYNGTYLYRTYKGIMWRMAWPAPETIDTSLPVYDSSFTAQGDISGSGATIHNTAGSTNATPLGMQAGQTIQAAGGTTVGSVGQAPVLANLSLPPGGLFHTNTESQARYLVETNPAFANRTEWLSSDWYFQSLKLDPTTIQKRLGDGFYEQKLIREEILSLTGKAMLGGYANEEAQFREMMTAGATLVQALDIRPGISLNAEQVAKLTSNVIIMETRVVDGNSVLVPVVYLARINQGDLLPTGSMIAATNINLTNTKAFTNSGTIKASNALSLGGQAIDNRGGNLQSGGLMALNTAGDIDFTSASVKAGSLQLQTRHDLKLNTDAKTMTVT